MWSVWDVSNTRSPEKTFSLSLTYDKAVCHPQQLQLEWHGCWTLSSDSHFETKAVSGLRALQWRQNQKIKPKTVRIQHNLNETQNHTCPKWPALHKSECNLKWDIPQVQCNCLSANQHQASPAYLLGVTLFPTYNNFPSKHAMTEKQASTAEISKNLLLTCSSYWPILSYLGSLAGLIYFSTNSLNISCSTTSQ